LAWFLCPNVLSPRNFLEIIGGDDESLNFKMIRPLARI
jgi:hypothetical protein